MKIIDVLVSFGELIIYVISMIIFLESKELCK